MDWVKGVNDDQKMVSNIYLNAKLLEWVIPLHRQKLKFISFMPLLIFIYLLLKFLKCIYLVHKCMPLFVCDRFNCT